MADPNPVQEILKDGSQRIVTREWIGEEPIALEFNGITYAVMMATPRDLEDFVIGFALSEGLAHSASAITDIAIAQVETGWIIRSAISGVGAEKLSERVRARVSESSCGLCGIENLEQLAKPLPRVPPHTAITAKAIFAALAELGSHQPLSRAMGSAHAAVWANDQGQIGYAREDVGRHNALDKLIGAMAVDHTAMSPGFILSTARCSYEIVEKTVRAGATSLVTISLPTTMAVSRAKAAGLSLWVLARNDSVLLVSSESESQRNPI